MLNDLELWFSLSLQVVYQWLSYAMMLGPQRPAWLLKCLWNVVPVVLSLC